MSAKTLRRIAALTAASILSCAALTACGSGSSSKKEPETPEEFRAAMIERSVVSTGNTARLNRVFDRAEKGEDLTIAYVGGSITEGYAAGSRSPQCYASVSAAAFQEAYCKGGTVTCQNNGLSGTPSILGNLRVGSEVLEAAPDIIFLEFAVNDGTEMDYKVCYESLVRTCLEAENEPAVILLFTYMETGHTCQEQQQEIGAHYDLGMISVRDAILPEMEAGRMQWSEYGDDDVHPTVQGHALLGEFIAEYFKEAKAKKADASYQIPADTVYPNLYRNGQLHDASDTQYRDGAWAPGTNNSYFRAGFVYQPNGDNAPLTMTVTGKSLFLVYKKANDKSFGMATVFINGERAAIVNGYGVNAWGGPAVELIQANDGVQEMKVEIKMLDDQTDKAFEVFALGTGE
ncbi:MAG: SGNH/GDSL hydrolase family protein [Oscillospiraceae bacterium]|nr:SGNH/GDSL hydrolase family protein [Oscillospiraceae bacterium]